MNRKVKQLLLVGLGPVVYRVCDLGDIASNCRDYSKAVESDTVTHICELFEGKKFAFIVFLVNVN